MSSGLSPTASLYRGALLGQALSKQLGIGQATGEDIDLSIRKGLLQAGVATGRVNPASLSSQDALLLKDSLVSPGITVPTIHTGGGGPGGILGAIETAGKVITNTAGDFASAVEGLPQGLASLGEAAYRTFNPIANTIESTLGLPTYKTPKGPDLTDVGKAIVQSTAHDFTHFDPMHPLYPALDVATAVSGGLSGAARVGGTLARLGEAAGEGTALSKAGEYGRALAGKIVGGERPGLIHPTTADTAESGIQVPTLPVGSHSISPFRRIALEMPIDAFFQSRLANVPLGEGTTLQDLRSAYHVRRVANVMRGRASSTAVGETARATQDFNRAMMALRHESPNEAVAAEKFNALVLRRKLAGDQLGPEDSLALLDQYRDKVLATGTPQVEGVAMDTAEAKAMRNYYRTLTASKEFRTYFSQPTEAMSRVKDTWDSAIAKGLQSLHIDPHVVLERSLGPAAHILNKSPEELLREQPEDIQRAMNFARGAHDLEQALKESGGQVVPEEALIPRMAAELPGNLPWSHKLKLMQDAVESLREDIQGKYSRRQLMNNAEATGYLQGNTLAQKVATGLHDRLGVDAHIAEPFASGGLTNYFPEASALNMKLRYQGGPIARAMDKLPGVDLGASRRAPQEFRFRHASSARLLRAETLGVAPFASFLEDADLSAFKAGVDRRDPITFARHISQRERVLAHRMLSEPLIERLALKGADGRPLITHSDVELQNKLGSVVAAGKWYRISAKAIQTLIQSEDAAASEFARALQQEGHLTPELEAHADQVIDESANMYVRNLADEVIANKDGMMALPKSYVENLINHAKVIDSARGPGHLWQGFINRWRTAVLAYMPSWLLRTSIGHGVVLFIGGIWNPVHYAKAIDYFGEGFKVPGTETRLGGLDRDVPAGVEQGSPHTDFGKFGMQRMATNRVATLTTHGVHTIMNFQRRAAFLSLLHKVERQHQWTELGNAMKLPLGFARNENIDRAIAEHPEWVHQAINELDRISYTFGQMSPLERRLAKNILPFWGWYKFVSKFVWSLPLTYPGRALAIARLGQIGQSDQEALGQMPDWLRASLMFNTHNLAAVHYISMLGLNPMGDVVDPAHGFQGLIRLGQLSPVIQAGLEGMGYNTMTGGLENIDPASGIWEINGKFINLHTGQSYDSLDQASPLADVERAVGGVMRAFPEIRIGETAVVGGKPLYPESVPLLNERPIPSTNPPKDVSPVGIALQYLGVAPKTYNLQKYQVNLLKDIIRARSSIRKAVAKEKAMK